MPESLTEEQIAFRRVMVLLCRNEVARIDAARPYNAFVSREHDAAMIRTRKVYADFIEAFNPDAHDSV